MDPDIAGTVSPADGSRGSANSTLFGKGQSAALEEIAEDELVSVIGTLGGASARSAMRAMQRQCKSKADSKKRQGLREAEEEKQAATRENGEQTN